MAILGIQVGFRGCILRTRLFTLNPGFQVSRSQVKMTSKGLNLEPNFIDTWGVAFKQIWESSFTNSACGERFPGFWHFLKDRFLDIASMD